MKRKRSRQVFLSSTVLCLLAFPLSQNQATQAWASSSDFLAPVSRSDQRKAPRRKWLLWAVGSLAAGGIWAAFHTGEQNESSSRTDTAPIGESPNTGQHPQITQILTLAQTNLKQDWLNDPEMSAAILSQIDRHLQGLEKYVVEFPSENKFLAIYDATHKIMRINGNLLGLLSNGEYSAVLTHELIHSLPKDRGRIQTLEAIQSWFYSRGRFNLQDASFRDALKTKVAIIVDMECNASKYQTVYQDRLAKASNQTLKAYYASIASLLNRPGTQAVKAIYDELSQKRDGFYGEGGAVDEDAVRIDTTFLSPSVSENEVRLIAKMAWVEGALTVEELQTMDVEGIMKHEKVNRWLLSWLKDPKYFEASFSKGNGTPNKHGPRQTIQSSP